MFNAILNLIKKIPFRFNQLSPQAAPKDKSRPISSTPVPGTPWSATLHQFCNLVQFKMSRCVVWTGDLRSFFYNPTNKQSVWEKPAEMVGRSDVAKMLESPQAAEEFKKRQQQKALPVFEEPVAKKARVVSEQTPVVMTIGNEEVMIIKDDTSKKLPQGKEAAIEAEVATSGTSRKPHPAGNNDLGLLPKNISLG